MPTGAASASYLAVARAFLPPDGIWSPYDDGLFDGNLRRGFRGSLYQTTQILPFARGRAQSSRRAAQAGLSAADIAKMNADQTADLNAYRFPQSANFAVAPFRQRHVIPLVNASPPLNLMVQMPPGHFPTVRHGLKSRSFDSST